MTVTQIIAVVDLILAGSKIIGRVVIDRKADCYDLLGWVANADGCGRREILLCSVSGVREAIEIQRCLNSRAK